VKRVTLSNEVKKFDIVQPRADAGFSM